MSTHLPPERTFSRPSLQIPSQTVITGIKQRSTKKNPSHLISNLPTTLNALVSRKEVVSPKSPTSNSHCLSPIPFLRKSAQEREKNPIQSSKDKIPQYMMSPFPLNKILSEERQVDRNNSLSPKYQEPTRGARNSPAMVPSKKDLASKMSREDIELLLVAMRDLASIAKPSSKTKAAPLNRSLEIQRNTLAETLENMEELPPPERPSKILTQRSEDSDGSAVYPKKSSRYAYRRKSCCCNWCGGIPKFQRETDNNPLIPPVKIKHFVKRAPTVAVNKIGLDSWGFLRNNKKLRSSIVQNSSNRKAANSKVRLSVQSQGPNKSSGGMNTEESERKSRELENNYGEKREEFFGKKTLDGDKIAENLETVTSEFGGLKNMRKMRNKKRKTSKLQKNNKDDGKLTNQEKKAKSTRPKSKKQKSPKVRPPNKKMQKSLDPTNYIGTHRSLSTAVNMNTLLESSRKDPLNEPNFKAERLMTSPDCLPSQDEQIASSKLMQSSFRDPKQEKRETPESLNVKNRRVITKSKINESNIPEPSKDKSLKNPINSSAQLLSQGSAHETIEKDTVSNENKAQQKLREFMSDLTSKRNENIYKVYMSKSTIKIRSFDLKDLDSNKIQKESPGFEITAKDGAKAGENTEINEEKQKAQANRFKMFQKQRKYITTSLSLKSQENVQKC